eukprot:Rhum_TRINITY_DN10711_c0_g1::Rhum_TRINITY_DN10711_c0_g1_i1::g.39752::m.39752
MDTKDAVCDVESPAEQECRTERGYFAEEEPWYKKPLQYPAVAAVWHTVEPVLYQTYCVMDYVGEKVADALGITESRFQYAIDEHDRQMQRRRKKEQYLRTKLLEERDKERKRLGLPNPNAAATSLPPLPETHPQPEQLDSPSLSV